MNMMKIFKVGDEISGYCNGYFGRDDYEDKVCILVTPKYAIFEHVESGTAAALHYETDLEIAAVGWLEES